MGVPSLVDMAKRAAILNVDGIFDVGDISYRLLREVLRQIKSPQQLETIEQNSPHIAFESAEIWHAFIKRDIPEWARKIKENAPSDPSHWSRVYFKLKEEDMILQQAAEDKLKAAFQKLEANKVKYSSTIVQGIIPESSKKFLGSGPSRIAPQGARALQNAKTLTTKMAIFNRRSTRTAASSAAPYRTRQLGVVAQAPRAMIEQKIRVQQPPPKPLQHPSHAAKSSVPSTSTAFAPSSRAQVAQDRALNALRAKEQAEKEKRLKAIMAGHPAPAASAPVVSQPYKPKGVRATSSSNPSAQPSPPPKQQLPPAGHHPPSPPTQPPASAPAPKSRKRKADSCFMPARQRKRPA